MNNVNVSVTIITRNEAPNIEDCLRSVRRAAEIIVTDQFSTDGTAEIARSMGAVVYSEPWKGFAFHKNSAIEKASCPWVFSVDADERITQPLWDEIEEVLGRPETMTGYYVKRKNYFRGKWIRHGGWYPDHNLRLFRKSAGRFQERSVHEKVVLDGPAGYLENPLEHYTYRSVSDYLLRMERYSRLAAGEMGHDQKKCGYHTLLLRPLYTFIKMYGLKAGFLDGSEGFFLAVSYAYYTYLKYYRLMTKDYEPLAQPPG